LRVSAFSAINCLRVSAGVTASTALNQLMAASLLFRRQQWAPPLVSSYRCSPKQLMQIKISASGNMLIKALKLKIESNACSKLLHRA